MQKGVDAHDFILMVDLLNYSKQYQIFLAELSAGDQDE
jgi:hypothetical protein